MAGSIASVVTMGYGSWGSAALVVSLGYDLGAYVPVSPVEESTVARAGYRPSATQQKQRAAVTSTEYRVARGGEQR